MATATTEREANYEVQPGHTLLLGGKTYYPGKVLPRWFADRDGGLEGRLKFGVLGATGKPQNCEVGTTEPKTAEDPGPAMTAEMNRLQRENQEFAESNRQLAGQNAEFKKLNADLEIAVGKQAKEIIHLTAAAEDLDKAYADLKAANDKLTVEVADLKAELAKSKVQNPKK